MIFYLYYYNSLINPFSNQKLYYLRKTNRQLIVMLLLNICPFVLAQKRPNLKIIILLLNLLITIALLVFLNTKFESEMLALKLC